MGIANPDHKKADYIGPNDPLPKPLLRRLSPTALSWFEKDRDKFVLYYVLGAERDRQSKAMAIGSGFDARIKGEIEADLLGVPNRWVELFDSQVEKEHKTFVEKHSASILKKYKDCGAYRSLIKEISGFVGTPRFEFSVGMSVNIRGLACPIYGKPDAFFEMPECLVVLDWKVNGFMTQASPDAGYIRLWHENGHNAGAHKNTMPLIRHGMTVGAGGNMKADWQVQLRIYEMMIDPENEKPWVSGIEQLAFMRGELRVASHRITMPKEFCEKLNERIYQCWWAVHNEHYYPDLTKEESDARVRGLQMMDDLDLWIITQG